MSKCKEPGLPPGTQWRLHEKIVAEKEKCLVGAGVDAKGGAQAEELSESPIHFQRLFRSGSSRERRISLAARTVSREVWNPLLRFSTLNADPFTSPSDFQSSFPSDIAPSR